MNNDMNTPINQTINKHLFDTLKDTKHSLVGNPSIPTLLDGSDYLLKSIVDRFKIMNKETERVLNKKDVSPFDIIRSSSGLVKKVNNIEMNFKDDLEELARNFVIQEYDVDLEYVDLIVKLVPNFLPKTGMKPNPTNHIKLNLNSKEDVHRITNEVSKRRIINAITQGASYSFNHVYHLYKNQLNEMDTRLYDAYQVVMTTGEMMYYTPLADNLASSGLVGGKVEVIMPEREGEKIKIIAQAVTFPLLIHEAIKGVVELISMNGLPEDELECKYVLERADYTNAERWDMIFGHSIWKDITELMSVDAYSMKQHMLYELFKLPTDEFHDTMQEILLGSTKGKEFFDECVERVKSDFDEDSKYTNLSKLDDFDDYTDINEIDFSKF